LRALQATSHEHRRVLGQLREHSAAWLDSEQENHERLWAAAMRPTGTFQLTQSDRVAVDLGIFERLRHGAITSADLLLANR
jgi:hypothetical protein